MSAARRDRLEAYLATQRNPSKEALKRRGARWPLYAAVTGAMVTSATAANVVAGLTPKDEPLIRAVKLATARAVQANAAAPSITAGGVVPLNGSANLIQAG